MRIVSILAGLIGVVMAGGAWAHAAPREKWRTHYRITLEEECVAWLSSAPGGPRPGRWHNGLEVMVLQSREAAAQERICRMRIKARPGMAFGAVVWDLLVQRDLKQGADWRPEGGRRVSFERAGEHALEFSLPAGRRARIRIQRDARKRPIGIVPERPCAEVEPELVREMQSIQACRRDRDCTQELVGASWQCQDLVANGRAQPDLFYLLMEEVAAAGCFNDVVCALVIRETKGFVCADGLCRRKLK